MVLSDEIGILLSLLGVGSLLTTLGAVGIAACWDELPETVIGRPPGSDIIMSDVSDAGTEPDRGFLEETSRAPCVGGPWLLRPLLEGETLRALIFCRIRSYGTREGGTAGSCFGKVLIPFRVAQ